MNRNVNSHFAYNPTNIDMQRSTFDRSCSIKTSFNTGELIPFYVDEVLPGDTFNVKTSKVVRLQTMLTPMMDNMYLDTYYFFVPNRLVWDHWREFNGENTQSAWIPATEYEIPQVTPPAGGWQIGTIADYMGIPTGVAGNLSVSALPFRAYALIVNEWFRDQNLQDPLNIPKDEATVAGVNTDNYITDCVKGGKPFIAAKYFDYFTSCLPSPQKGPDVSIKLFGDQADIPIYGSGKPLTFINSKSGDPNTTFMNIYSSSGTPYTTNHVSSVLSTGYPSDKSGSGRLGLITKNQINQYHDGDYTETGLISNISGINIATINQLRLAFQIQKLYERDARGGTRYIEILKSHFGVTSPDARLQRPEYLGGNRIPINVNQIVQQSATGSGDTPQGNPSGLSMTTDNNNDFTKSFVEHGFVIGLMVARYDHTYQQGLERMWSRKSRFDYYWPVLANIGEQAVLNKEIYAAGTEEDDEVFGYNEAWADYRYKPNRVSGEMRSSAPASLDVWHLGDDYESTPRLSASWIREDKSNVDRVLAVSSSVSNQLFADIFVRNKTTRPMPMYSIPGLIDHH